jgi:aerobic carbon-monoxide dehydrogenase large subunit
MSWVGRSIPRSEDRRLVQGLGRFTSDLASSSLILRFVRSPVARGRIIGIEKPSGATVITAADLEGVKPIRPVLNRKDYVAIGQPILAADRVCFAGQPLAAVIAASAEEAEDIAEQVFADIELETPIIDIDVALDARATKIHPETRNNVLVEGFIETPDFATTIALAKYVVEIEIRSRRQNATPLEARGAVASYDRATGRVTLIASVQMPHMLRTGIADLLGFPEAQLRVIAPDVGGGFGQKISLVPEYVLAVWAAIKLRGSVAWIEDRRENLTAAFHGRDQRYTLHGGFDDDGRLIALEADICCNVGAFSCYPVTCGVEPLMAMAELPGPYDFRAYKVRARGIATNTCPMAPYRGVSRPVLTLAVERLMDIAARQIGIDPIEIRQRSLVKSWPYQSPAGIRYDEGSYVASLDHAARAIGIKSFRKRQREAFLAGRYIGVGFSVFNERSGYGTLAFAARAMEITPGFETVEIVMDPSGTIEARIGASPHGQGLLTCLSQLIADALGVTPADVRIIHGDTDATPYGWGTFASRSMVIAGGACKLAADALREKLAKVAARLLQCSPEDVLLVEGKAMVRSGGASLEIGKVARAAYHQAHLFKSDIENGLRATATYDPPGTYSNACHVAIVEVDPETGHVCIKRFVVIEDAGLIVNPRIADGQIHGGVAQGIANALFEEIVYDTNGNILTASLMDYLLPTSAEVPMIEIDHLVTITDATITGAKGLGEGGAIGAPAAVINAIADALSPLGIEPMEMPITPSGLRSLIRSAEAKARP